MSVIAAALRELIAAGLSGEALVEAVARIDAAMPDCSATTDPVAERKRTADRERMRRHREVARQSRDNATVATYPPEEMSPTPPKTQTPPTVPPSPPKGGGFPLDTQKSKGCFLPKDWVPTADGFDRAMAELRSRDAVARELEKFRNFWFAKSGADGRKRDWEATWRNWIMRAADDGKRNGNRNGGRASSADAYLAAANELLGELGHGGRGEAGIPDGPHADLGGPRRHQLEDRRHPVGIGPGAF